MEHLPRVLNPYEPISIPFIADEYDGGLFEDYPSRRGLDLGRLTQGDFQNLSAGAVASFLQTWLFFGLLHGILGINLRTEEFVRLDEDGKKWLTTAKLPAYLHRVHELVKKEKKMPEYTEEYVKRRNDRIEICLRLSQDVWEHFNRLPQRFKVPNPMSDELALGIHILAITLQVGATEICGGAQGEPTYRKVPWETGRHWRVTRNNFLDQRMVAQGWCPSVVRQIWSHENPIGQYYSSLLGPPSRKVNHECCDFEDRDCEAMKKLPLSHIKHEQEDCQCDVLLVDHVELAEIIQREEIAVLRLIEHDGMPVLDVVSSKSERHLEYTAMSHVWTDGWGNPNENSLPLCRVQKLVRDIAATYTMPDFDDRTPQGKYFRSKRHDGRVFFWMDTLCVPRTPEEIHSRAIVQMRDVYESAERVLVYDADLMASTSKDSSYEELNMRVSNSRWIRRLWTVQEAVLAKRLIYQFADGPQMFMVGSLWWHARNKDLALNYFNSVGWDCTHQMDYYTSIERSLLLNHVWVSLLRNRSVTVASDEAICFCILMNFDVKKLLAVPESDRIQFTWTLLGDAVPHAVLFISGRRLTAKGFSWAPASILDCTEAGPTIRQLCSISEDGLRAKIRPYTSFFVDAPQQLTEACFPCTLQGRKYFIKKSPVRKNPEWKGLDLHRRPSLAVILELPVSRDNDGVWSFIGSRGALVSIVRSENGVLFAEYLRLTSVVQEGSIYHKFPVIPWTPQEVEGSVRAPSEARWIDVEQEWCFV